MASDAARQYLQDYILTSQSFYKDMFHRVEQEVSVLSPLIADIISKLHALGARGKKIRGALVVLGYELASSESSQEIISASLFAELFHLGLLIQDDIMDGDDLRRGLPTIHSQHGVPMAINASDIAFSLSWEALLYSKFPDTRKIAAAKLYAGHFRRVVYGQMLDVSMAKTNGARKEDILDMERLKTGEYSGVLPLSVGFTLGGGESEKLPALETYGRCLGWAFQISDDLLGTFGNVKDTGKPDDSDIREGKQTILVWYVQNKGNASDKKVLASFDIEKIRQLFISSGARDYATSELQSFVKKGKDTIGILTTDIKLSELLSSFLDFQATRTK